VRIVARCVGELRPGNDRLLGGIGDERLVGDGGNDSLNGSTGTDDGNGGPGADFCANIEDAVSC
jgi:Ca2+-binding RTX toxin-like protein